MLRKELIVNSFLSFFILENLNGIIFGSDSRLEACATFLLHPYEKAVEVEERDAICIDTDGSVVLVPGVFLAYLH